MSAGLSKLPSGLLFTPLPRGGHLPGKLCWIHGFLGQRG
jgi:hypothetical protein